MNTYTILKRARGEYQLINQDGLNLSGRYTVSKHEAQQLKTQHQLQEKALADPRILEQAQRITSVANIEDWLYQTLIRFDTEELRYLIKKPKRLKELSDAVIERMQKQLKKKVPENDLEAFELAVGPAIKYLQEQHPHTTIIVTSEGAQLLEGILGINSKI